jgi:hypothetical protein
MHGMLTVVERLQTYLGWSAPPPTLRLVGTADGPTSPWPTSRRPAG